MDLRSSAQKDPNISNYSGDAAAGVNGRHREDQAIAKTPV
jgi:hypothetical protein